MSGIEAYDLGREDGAAEERERIVSLLVESSKCTLDSGHHKLGYCFCEAIALIKREQMSDSLEKGYKLLAKDPEMFQRRLLHHCGFDFTADEATAKCVCGAIATNPFWTIKGQQNPHVRAETMALTTLNTANIENSARPCGCKGETND